MRHLVLIRCNCTRMLMSMQPLVRIEAWRLVPVVPPQDSRRVAAVVGVA